MDFDRSSMPSGDRTRHFEMPGSDIRLTGLLKKMKTMKKKYFVLRSTSSSGPARLEYFDSEKKYHTGQPPKRVIHLHTCFNINRKSDSRHRHAIALYTKEDCFSLVCEDEKEQEKWLACLLEYQNEFLKEGERGREHYDFVWQVTIQPKGLGQTMNIRGPYRLCLNRHSIYLFKLNMDKPHYVFQLETVRSVGHQDNMFKLVVGKISPTGEGELLMHSDDAIITQNIHETILDFMKNMDRRQDSFDNRRTFNESLHNSASSLPRPPPEFRHRSETFTQGSNRTRPRVERPMSVCTRTTRSTSHLHSAVSPGSSPHIHGFMEHQIMGSHRFRSNSNESKASRSSFSAASDDFMHDHHNLNVMRPALQEEPDLDTSLGLDLPSDLTSPGSIQLDFEEADGPGDQSYMEMNPGTSSASSSSNAAYIDMAPGAHKGAELKEGWGDQVSTYMPMGSIRSSSAPIPIHPPHAEHGYLEMTAHTVLPPVKEGGSNEGYVPMSPPYNPGSYGSHTGQLKPDRVKCMLSDDSNDFAQPPLRTYSLGSRPVKTGAAKTTTGYMDMSGGKKVSDNGRSCSAPHLVHPQVHRGGRSSNMESPTPSASPLSMSLKSDDSDAFMELDFYRPRTASDSYNYRPRASSFGMPQSSLAQSHRPRSSSHGQGTRPVRRHKMLAEGMGRLNQEAMLRSHNASHNSVDSLKVSSSESLKKLSQEIRTKTSQLNNSGYMDMSGEKRFTPSPQPGPAVKNQTEREGYVAMTPGKQDSYMNMTCGGHKATPGFRPFTNKSSSCEKSQVSDSPDTSAVASTPARDSVYVNFDSSEGIRWKDSPPCLSENAEAYMAYEPAPSGQACSAAGKEGVPASSGSTPKERPSEGKKRGGFFSLRHGQGDSGKQSSKKSESASQTGGGLFSTTGGQQFGSLGRDFRKKSKDLSKAARQKSSSFSKTFGISTSKPGKLLRKTPTPPSSLDGNDEYIEFIPTAGKSDSDSSHSSGSFKATAARPEAIPAAEEAAYVGFEPGNIPAASFPSTRRDPVIPASSSYLPMTVGGAGHPKVFTVIKPSKKTGTKRREDSSSATTAQPPESDPGKTAAGQFSTPSPISYDHTNPNQPTSANQPPWDGRSSLVRPKAVHCDPGSLPVCREEDPGQSSLPTCSAQFLASGAGPAALPSVTERVSGKNESSAPSMTLVSTPAARVPESDDGCVDRAAPGPVTRCCVSECPLCAQPPTALSPMSCAWSSPSCCCSPSSLSTPISSWQTSTPVLRPPDPNLAPPPSDDGYMHFDPAGVRPAGEGAPHSEVTPGVRSCSTTEPQGCGPTSSMTTRSTSADTAKTSSPSQTSVSASVGTAQQPVTSSSSVTPVTRKGSGAEGNRARRRSGSRRDSAGTQAAEELSAPSLEQSSTEKLCAGGSGTMEPVPSGVESCAVTGGQTPQACGPCDLLPSSVGVGVMRLDSVPYTAPVSGGQGRGRHYSSGSVGAPRSTAGAGSSGSSTAGPDPGQRPINMRMDTRHSLSDLTGGQQMIFASNALSRQQPALVESPQRQQCPAGEGSGSTGGGQGGLHYAKLDLSSADSLGDAGDGVRSPRSRSRHSSAAEEKSVPLSYATIDFEKSESLRAGATKDVKLIL